MVATHGLGAGLHMPLQVGVRFPPLLPRRSDTGILMQFGPLHNAGDGQGKRIAVLSGAVVTVPETYER